jgi:hypothetical protein
MRLFRAAPAVALILALLALGAAPAEARRGRTDPERNSPQAIRALHDFGRCVARDHWSRGRVREVLAMDYRTDASRQALRGFVQDRGQCVAPDHMLSANLLLFAGGLAEASLPRDRDLAAAVAYDPARPPFQARDEIEVMSLCAVRADPASVATLFATVPASAEEGAALRALAPHLGQCLRAGGRTRLNPLEIRALLALAAWRLSEHNAAPLAATNGSRPDQPPVH